MTDILIYLFNGAQPIAYWTCVIMFWWLIGLVIPLLTIPRKKHLVILIVMLSIMIGGGFLTWIFTPETMKPGRYCEPITIKYSDNDISFIMHAKKCRSKIIGDQKLSDWGITKNGRIEFIH